MKKARYYVFVLIAVMSVAVYATYMQAPEPGQWLCSGRYVVMGGYVEYDYKLAYWLITGGVLIACAYFAIPALIQKVRVSRDDLTPPIDEALKKFIAFIVVCGIGHLIDSANIFLHQYYIAAGWHTVTAIISIDTYFTLRNNAGYFLTMPSRAYFDQYVKISQEMQNKYKTGFWWFSTIDGTVKWSNGMREIYCKSKDWVVNLDEIDEMVDPEYREHYEKETNDHRSQDGGQNTFDYGIICNGEKKLLRAVVNRGASGEIYGSVQDLTKVDLSIDELVRGLEDLPYPTQLIELRSISAKVQNKINDITLKKLTNGDSD